MWLAVKDLLDKTNSIETRHCVLGFFRALINGQYEELGVLRAHFLHVIQDHTIEEDFQPWSVILTLPSLSLYIITFFSFDVVCTLTDSGKDILHMEQEMGQPMMTSYYITMHHHNYTGPYLSKIISRAMESGRYNY